MYAGASQTETPLLDLVAFKWLMAGRGWWVNLSRMQRDPGYLRTCAQCGLDSGDAPLEQRSAELLAALARVQYQRSVGGAFAFSNDVRI